MKLAGALLLLIVMTGSWGCARQPVVKANAVSGADFQRFRTYAIKPGNVVYPGAPAAQREEIELRIQDAVAAELEARGLTAQPDGPDVIVTYTAGAQRKAVAGEDVRHPAGVDVRGTGGGGYDEPGAVTARESPGASADRLARSGYTEGNLVIDLLDGATRKLVWRATVNLELASDQGARMIRPIVARAFGRYPVKRLSAVR